MLPEVPRKAFRLRAAYEPTRLGDQPLKTAYDEVVPIRRRRFLKPPTTISVSLSEEADQEKGKHHENDRPICKGVIG
jgi:hypothetical protein